MKIYITHGFIGEKYKFKIILNIKNLFNIMFFLTFILLFLKL
jgi:hypothetical protein